MTAADTGVLAAPRAPGPAGAPALPPDLPIVVFASACWDAPTPTNTHQVARRFAARGHRVLFVESVGLRTPRLGSARDRRRVRERLVLWGAGPRAVGERLWALAPLAMPAARPAALAAWTMRRLGRRVADTAARLGMPRPVAWAFLPVYAPALDALDPRCTVYHCVDRYDGNPGVDPSRLARLEQRMVARADLLLAASPALARRLAAGGRTVHAVPNVADVALFSRAVTESLPEPGALAGRPRPRLLYAGNLAAYRNDLDLLLRLSRARPDATLVIVGAVGVGDLRDRPPGLAELAARPNVLLHDAVATSALPAWMAACDVGLMPFLDNAHTRAGLPLKLWEYLAAGLPVVATDLPNLRPVAADGLVRLARGHDAFVAAVDAALSEPDRRAARLAAARDHDWSARMDELSRLLAAALRGRA